MNLVVPLVQKTTDMRNRETGDSRRTGLAQFPHRSAQAFGAAT
jgi:hypothetical protein